MFPQTFAHSLTLTATPLVFVCEALTPLRLDGYRAGSNLRGALGDVMRRAYCGHWPTPGLRPAYASPATRGRAGVGADSAHTSTCPVCWLLAANEQPGVERRGYALVPPVTPPDVYEPGQRFDFGVTLFGSALRYLPYFILAVPEMGRMGVGPGRGKFALRQVWAVNPLNGKRECVLAEGESLVHSPGLTLGATHVIEAAEAWASRLNGSGQLAVRFLSPMRLIENEKLVKVPDFGILFARLLDRLDRLEQQFGGGWRRPLEEVQMLQARADRVHLIDSQTEWVDVWSGSSRTGNRTPIGGFVGRATYSAPADVLRSLLPWLLWGVATQAGKDTVKGNGVFVTLAPGAGAGVGN